MHICRPRGAHTAQRYPHLAKDRARPEELAFPVPYRRLKPAPKARGQQLKLRQSPAPLSTQIYIPSRNPPLSDPEFPIEPHLTTLATFDDQPVRSRLYASRGLV